MDATWRRIAALVEARAPGGLRGPADPTRLAELPPTWRGLWGLHDGQTDRVGNLFLDQWFLPLSGPESVESESESLPDGYLPIAKDFGGGYLAVDVSTGRVVELSGAGDATELADGPASFLAKVLAHLEQHPPEPWTERDGRPVPASRIVVDLADLAEWAVGEVRDLREGLVMVRVESPDPAPFTQMGTRIDLAIDHPEAAAPAGALVSLRLAMPTGPEGTTSDAQAGVGREGDRHWVEATGPIPRAAVLKVEVDLARPLTGPRPLFRARAPSPSTARAEARLALGDAAGAYEDAIATRPLDPALAATCALAARLVGPARQHANALPRGHRVRVRVFADSDPDRALLDLGDWLARDPDGVAFAWRAQVHERLGDFAAAASDTDRAISLLSVRLPEHVPGLRAALRRRRARTAAPKMDAPILEDSTEDAVLGDAFPCELTLSGWQARIEVTPAQAAHGGLVELAFPDGQRGAVRLPKGAGEGLKATVHVGEPVHVVVAIRLPRSWPADADNPTLAFERWDALAVVPHWQSRVRIAGPDGTVHEVPWPRPEDRVKVPGAGLARADGTRGDLWVQGPPDPR